MPPGTAPCALRAWQPGCLPRPRFPQRRTTRSFGQPVGSTNMGISISHFYVIDALPHTWAVPR
eukprot:29038-Alexandrium_andersonii.AAC.1